MQGLTQTSAPNLALAKKGLDQIFDEARQDNEVPGKVTATDPIVFTQGTASNAAKITEVMGGGDYFQKNFDDMGTIKEATINGFTPKTTLMANFNKNLAISRTFMDDQQEDAVGVAVRESAQTWLASRDRNAVAPFQLGFTTQLTIDGVALFSNSHLNANGDTVDNLETGVFNDTNMNVAANSLRTQINQSGVKPGYTLKFLLLPSLLHSLGQQVTKSVLRQGTGNNDTNYWSDLYPTMKTVYSQFLDEQSTTAWFIGTSYHGVMRFVREAFFTKLVNWETADNDAYKYKMRAREEVDAISYNGLVGSNGTV